MDDHAPVTLTLGIAAFRAIASAVTEAEIGGDVSSVTVSRLTPDLQLMEGAVGVEVVIGEGPGRRRATWIVAGEGEVVARLEDPAGSGDDSRSGDDAESDDPKGDEVES